MNLLDEVLRQDLSRQLTEGIRIAYNPFYKSASEDTSYAGYVASLKAKRARMSKTPNPFEIDL